MGFEVGFGPGVGVWDQEEFDGVDEGSFYIWGGVWEGSWWSLGIDMEC